MPSAHTPTSARRPFAHHAALSIAAALAAAAHAQITPTLTEPTGPALCTEYADGQARTYDTYTSWRQMCSGTPGALSAAGLAASVEEHHRQLADRANVVTIDSSGSGLRGTNVNIVFNINAANAPAGYATAFSLAEQYLESKFSNPITMTIDVSWAGLPSGVLGSTGSSFVSNVSYTSSRAGLVNGMDADDSLQSMLPIGSTVPVRFGATATTVSNVGTIDWTRANYRATVGSTSGTDCSMQFSTNFTFDLDPTNGVSGGQTSLVDVIIHEVGHGLGFVSAADNQSATDIRSLDLFRFARSDRAGVGNTNPDSTADFQATPREVDYNSPGNEDANTDLISAEYRMSDGSPYQASHFFQQSANPASALGIMQPAFASGVTFGPDYLRTPDLAVFDAIGWTLVGTTGDCPVDADGDGQVLPADVATFVNAWAASLQSGSSAGDFDNNGSVTPSDVAAFVAAWFTAVANGGC